MIIETNSEKETWDLGFSLGEKACAGQVYTLSRSMMKEDFPFIILMCTESVMWKRWKRLAMKITFTERASA